MLAALGMSLTLSACTSFISRTGPTYRAIISSSEIRVQAGTPQAKLGYALVRVDASVIARLQSQDAPLRFDAFLIDEPAQPVNVGVGDVLTVTVFETGSGGLFIPTDAGSRPGNFVQLPPQQVGRDGAITVPWAGKIAAAGRTPLAIQETIRERLAHRALEPQVIVTFTERHANEVSVLGDVNAATRFSMDPSGERVLGAIARAGGPRFPAYETLVRLQRQGHEYTALLSEIGEQPSQNVRLQAGDTIYIEHKPRYFLAVGATGQTTTLSQLDRRFPFGDEKLTLADALATAGGLQDDLADAQGVFLFRYETHATLVALGLPVPDSLPAQVPTIYAVDMTDPAGFFYARRFWMRDGDTIFASNAPASDLQKFLNLADPFMQTVEFVKLVK
ncbi:MAG TPA: polysaccharide biosynthesis/export family protein [Rhizomicrobium sp.]|nr:polysaccharide biosynthesis/export family protein [Rhizomicrobium sp.]